MGYFQDEELEAIVKEAIDCYINITKVLNIEKDVPITPLSRVSIATLAVRKLQTREGPILRCHQCRKQRAKCMMVSCSSCDASYCCSCLWNRYMIKQIEVEMSLEPFVCPFCKRSCNCPPCLKERGESLSLQFSNV
eukprot:TRINITY_DN5410_c0_g1_i2.p1 TRINITY_DN5410_c0_g1~~TRINITY_DN5410_c0_g1_i2.p1  ORF type:complete len:136 (-),score=11.96 TRINITY_DN5410_c0_g1_i2:35-442(-)